RRPTAASPRPPRGATRAAASRSPPASRSSRSRSACRSRWAARWSRPPRAGCAGAGAKPRSTPPEIAAVRPRRRAGPGGPPGRERERARLERGERRRARRGEEVAAERVARDEGDRVDEAVEPPPALLDLGRGRLELLGVVDVELEHVRLGGQAPRDALRDAQP